MPCFLIGVDDTDNAESRGTGHLARGLLTFLAENGLVRPRSVTRHQLLVSPEIPYTSHNSSACLCMEAEATAGPKLFAAATDYVVGVCASGSDPGVCVVAADAVPPSVVAWGEKAKASVLLQRDAEMLAESHGILLAGLAGTYQGVIGALAAVGLHRGGDDGRFLWLPGLRELEEGGLMSVGDLAAAAAIDAVQTPQGNNVPSIDLVRVGAWMRPLLRGGDAVLLVDSFGEEGRNGQHLWCALDKAEVKRRSS